MGRGAHRTDHRASKAQPGGELFGDHLDALGTATNDKNPPGPRSWRYSVDWPVGNAAARGLRRMRPQYQEKIEDQQVPIRYAADGGDGLRVSRVLEAKAKLAQRTTI